MSDDDDILSYEESWEDPDREWDVLLGPDHVATLTDWLGALCPATLGLHECRLDDGARVNARGNTPQERYDAYTTRLIDSSKELYSKFQKKFPDIFELFSKIERREDEEDWEVLDDFWQSVQKEWMFVANEDARAILKPLQDGRDILTMASIHRRIAMSPFNMTNFASAVIKVDNPDVYAVSKAVDKVSGQVEDDAMFWNFPAATDVLRHLAAHYDS